MPEAKRAHGERAQSCVSTESIGGKNSQPVCAVTDAHGVLYVATQKEIFVRLACGRSATVSVSIGLEQVSGMAFGGANELLLVDTEANSILMVDGANTTVRVAGDRTGDGGFQDGVGELASFWKPYGVAYMPKHDVFLVSDSGNHCIRALARSTWDVTTCCGEATVAGDSDGVGTLAGFHNPRGIARVDDDSFVVADYRNNAIRLVCLDAGGHAHVSTIPSSVIRPLSVAVDGAGSIIVVCDSVHNVVLVAKAPGAPFYHTTAVAGSAAVPGFRDGPCLSALFSSPFYVHIDAQARVLVVERRSSSYKAPSNTILRVLECGLVPAAPARAAPCERAAARRRRFDMLEQRLFVDVQILLQDGSRAGAHSSALYPHSAFFRARLDAALASGAHAPLVIDLRTFRVTPGQLHVLLRYIYTQSLPDMMGACLDPTVTPLEMCRVADMMLEETMYGLCLQQMALALNADNIREVAYQAHATRLEGPLQQIAAFWVRNPSLVTSALSDSMTPLGLPLGPA